jgi:transposase-like protein
MNDKRVTTGEVQAHLAEIYGVQVSGDTISTITDRVLDSLAEWQSHPLDSVGAVTFIYVINVKIRDGTVANRPIYVEQGRQSRRRAGRPRAMAGSTATGIAARAGSNNQDQVRPSS